MNINEISLHEEVLKSASNKYDEESQTLESIGENETECVTRSEPNIQSELNDHLNKLATSMNTLSLSNDNLASKRAESEPSILHSVPN